jgi:hypothetical protein
MKDKALRALGTIAAHIGAMRRFVFGLLIFAGCYAQDQTFAQTTLIDPAMVSGPPGGGMDPGYGYTQSGYESQGYEVGFDATLTDPQAEADATAQVTDTEIDTTLQPYGEWIEDGDYGRVWRPYATVVGVDFTPYETCGSWVSSNSGWAFQCDWDWGWLPFHYGNWGWFDDGGYWGWVPGYEWTPAAVEWRNGGGYVGWRPLVPQIRDHRGQHPGPTFHDHRTLTAHDAHWRFATETDFGKPHIRSHELRTPAEGLRATQPVLSVPFHDGQPVRAASLMRARLMTNPRWSSAQNSVGARPMTPATPARPMRPSESATWQRQPVRTYQDPTWRAPAYRQPVQSYQPPTYQQPTYQQPTYQQPVRTYQPQGDRPVQSYHPTYEPPARQSYHPAESFHPQQPSRPSYSPSYNPPSHSSWSGSSQPSYSPPSHPTYSAPSHSSGGFGNSGGGHMGGGGGGGVRRH